MLEHARYYCGFYCHAKIRAYARCGAIRQSVGHNRPDSRFGTKYANSADVARGQPDKNNKRERLHVFIHRWIHKNIHANTNDG